MGIAKFEALPDKGKPLNEWQPESMGWQNIVDGIHEVIDICKDRDTRKVIKPQVSQSSQEEMEANLVYQKGNFLLMLGQADLAIQSYNRAIELNSDDADAYISRGVAYTDMGEYDRAIVNFDKAIKLKPNYAEAYNNRGVAYDDMGDYGRAIEDYNNSH